MSKNSKNAKRIQAAREMSATRKNGGKGPSKTEPKHGKKNAWWQKFKSYSDFIKGGAKAARRQEEAEPA